MYQTLSANRPGAALCSMCMNDLFQSGAVAVHTIPDNLTSRHEKLAWLLVGLANARVKKLHARELSRNQWILRFDVILQDDWPVEQCLLHIRVFPAV